MMRIRCPNCDSTHEVPSSLLQGGPRKVRCAACRTIFEASAERDSPRPGSPEPAMPDPAARPAGDPSGTPEAVASGAAGIGPDDLDMLLAVPDRTMAAGAQAHPPDAVFPELDHAASTIATPARASPGDPSDKTDEPDGPTEMAAPAPTAPEQENRPRRRPPGPPRAQGRFRLIPALGLVGAIGIGSLVGLTVFRHEAVRVAPALAGFFDMLGLDSNTTGLEIHAVRSLIVMEDQREMLEISGQIVNITRMRRVVPVLHFSLHDASGQQLYVWTGTAEETEIAGGESVPFRRRLASPPKEAIQAMVRFAARDDIVAAIR